MTKLEKIPHSIEAGQSLLGAILLDNSLIKVVKQHNSDIFYKEAHKLIFNTMIELDNDNIAIDIITLCERMKSKVNLDDIGGISYITSLLSIVPTSSNYKYYLDILIDCKLKRDIINVSKQTTISASDDVSGIELLSNLKETLDDIEIISDKNFIVDIMKISDEDDDNVERVSTSFYELNKRLRGGYQFGSLNIFAGWQGSGKSTLTNQMIIAESILQGYKTFLYSGEMTTNNILRWITLTVANEDQLIITSSNYGDYIKASDECKFMVKEWLYNNFYLYSNNKNITLDSLIINMTYLAKKEGVKVFIIDNLLKLITSTNSKDELMAQTEAVDKLKNFATENNVLVHLIAHCKKTGDRSKAPTIEDISGTANIANLADYVTCIHRIQQDLQEEKSIMSYDAGLYLYKNRYGLEMHKPLRMFFSSERKRFYTGAEELNKDYKYHRDSRFIQVNLDTPF